MKYHITYFVCALFINNIVKDTIECYEYSNVVISCWCDCIMIDLKNKNGTKLSKNKEQKPSVNRVNFRKSLLAYKWAYKWAFMDMMKYYFYLYFIFWEKTASVLLLFNIKTLSVKNLSNMSLLRRPVPNVQYNSVNMVKDNINLEQLLVWIISISF